MRSPGGRLRAALAGPRDRADARVCRGAQPVHI